MGFLVLTPSSDHVPEDLLNKIICGLHHRFGVEDDQVVRPLCSFRKIEERRIGGHLHLIAISLNTGKERRLGQSREEAVGMDIVGHFSRHQAVGGVFSKIYLRAAPGIMVKFPGCPEKPLRRMVAVLID